MSCLEGDYSIYIEVTCCDSKGDVKKELIDSTRLAMI